MMDETATVATNGTERLSAENLHKKAYLDYSRYVILDRALPSGRWSQTGATPHYLRHV